jgi:hypothetical protein
MTLVQNNWANLQRQSRLPLSSDIEISDYLDSLAPTCRSTDIIVERPPVNRCARRTPRREKAALTAVNEGRRRNG